MERPSSDKGTGKRKLTKGKKEGAEGVMAKGKLRGKGDREQEETLMSQEEYVMNREGGSVRLQCQEGTQKTSLPRAAATTERRPRDHFQDDTTTTKSSSAGFLRLDSTLFHNDGNGKRGQLLIDSAAAPFQAKDVEQRRRESSQDSTVTNKLRCQFPGMQTFADQSLQSESDGDGVDKPNSSRTERTIRPVEVD